MILQITGKKDHMDVSEIIPVYNEVESLPELENWIARVCIQNNHSYEIILIDDGSSDLSWKVISDLSVGNKAVKGISFRRNNGKAAALQSGV